MPSVRLQTTSQRGVGPMKPTFTLVVEADQLRIAETDERGDRIPVVPVTYSDGVLWVLDIQNLIPLHIKQDQLNAVDLAGLLEFWSTHGWSRVVTTLIAHDNLIRLTEPRPLTVEEAEHTVVAFKSLGL
jgi:hypothetical protein